MKIRGTILFLFLPFFVQCKTQQTNTDQMASYEYIDGNGNLYVISSTSIVYDPITPEESSTGTYSGGEPYVAFIEPKQFDEIEEVLQKVMNATSDQITEKRLGSGTLVLLPKKVIYIFDMNSASKKEIEAVIRLMTKR